jgi:hypothetical protein
MCIISDEPLKNIRYDAASFSSLIHGESGNSACHKLSSFEFLARHGKTRVFLSATLCCCIIILYEKTFIRKRIYNLV